MRDKRWLLLTLVLAAGIEAWLITTQALPFNADEAVVGLMARRILQGERLIFFYGQAYMGSLDAWLSAGVFLLLDAQVWVMRLVQSLLYLGVVGSAYLIGKEAAPGEGIGGLPWLPFVLLIWLAALLDNFRILGKKGGLPWELTALLKVLR